MSAAFVQSLVVLLLVLTAAAYLGRRIWRQLAAARAKSAGAGCGCGADGCGSGETGWDQVGKR